MELRGDGQQRPEVFVGCEVFRVVDGVRNLGDWRGFDGCWCRCRCRLELHFNHRLRRCHRCRTHSSHSLSHLRVSFVCHRFPCCRRPHLHVVRKILHFLRRVDSGDNFRGEDANGFAGEPRPQHCAGVLLPVAARLVDAVLAVLALAQQPSGVVQREGHFEGLPLELEFRFSGARVAQLQPPDFAATSAEFGRHGVGPHAGASFNDVIFANEIQRRDAVGHARHRQNDPITWRRQPQHRRSLECLAQRLDCGQRVRHSPVQRQCVVVRLTHNSQP